MNTRQSSRERRRSPAGVRQYAGFGPGLGPRGGGSGRGCGRGRPNNSSDNNNNCSGKLELLDSSDASYINQHPK